MTFIPYSPFLLRACNLLPGLDRRLDGTLRTHSESTAMLVLSLLENAFYAACDMALGGNSVPDETTRKALPVQAGWEPWGAWANAPPALFRNNNNCWFTIRVMDLWRRFIATAAQETTIGSRYRAVVIHRTASEPLSSVPNTLEAHSLLNGLVQILGIQDTSDYLDLTVCTSHSPGHRERCELYLIRTSAEEYTELLSGALPRLLPEPETAWEMTAENLVTLLAQAAHSADALWAINVICQAISLLRSNIQYTVIQRQPCLRPSRRSSGRTYRKLLDQNPFSHILDPGSGAIRIGTQAPFRSREGIAADLFIEELHRYIQTVPALAALLGKGAYRISIEVKRAKTDPDNIPFDRVIRLFQDQYGVALANHINVLYAPAAGENTTLILEPERL